MTCGGPVFDYQTEEPFGLVVAESEIGNLVRPELELMDADEQVYLIDDTGQILFTSSRETSSRHQPAADIFSNWEELKSQLKTASEYLDPDREVYATRLVFPQRNNSIYIVFRSH